MKHKEFVTQFAYLTGVANAQGLERLNFVAENESIVLTPTDEHAFYSCDANTARTQLFELADVVWEMYYPDDRKIELIPLQILVELVDGRMATLGLLLGAAMGKAYGTDVLHVDPDLISEIKQNGLESPIIIEANNPDFVDDPDPKIVAGREILNALVVIRLNDQEIWKKHFIDGVPVKIIYRGVGQADVHEAERPLQNA